MELKFEEETIVPLNLVNFSTSDKTDEMHLRNQKLFVGLVPYLGFLMVGL